jgi:hypothetical protein
MLNPNPECPITNFVEEENKLLNICVIDKSSRFYSVPNSKELIEDIKNQMEVHIETQKNCVIGNSQSGISYNLVDIIALYNNPKIIDNELYVDMKFLNTPISKPIIDIIKAYAEESLPIKFRVSMIGEVKEDGSILNTELVCINLLRYND